MGHPRPTAPRIPAAYGVPTDASGADLLPWSWAAERLEAARNYWLSTTRPDGRPHAMPVWAVWLEGALWFSTGPESQKARNLARAGWAVVHLESGDETVILEGEAVTVGDRSAIERFVSAYDEKYGWRLEPDDPNLPVYVLRPRVAHTWREADFPKTATRWVFD